MTTLKILYDRVNLLCVASNIDLRELEKQCGLSRYALDKWENGAAYIETIFKVADYFDVSIDYLTGKTNNPKSHKEPGVIERDNIKFKDSIVEMYGDIQKVMELLNIHMPHIRELDDNKKG